MDLRPPSKRKIGTGIHRVLVSAENNAYMAWQCQLIHYSCLSRLGQIPLIVVHGSQEFALSPGFGQIISAGGLVRRAPSYRVTASGHEYPPRNTPGTLLYAAGMNYSADDCFILCDPDMLFVRQPEFGRRLSADEFRRGLDFKHRDVRHAARKFGVALDTLDNSKLHCGVPHVIPVRDAARLATMWLEAIDAFKLGLWEHSMYGFVMAVAKLGMDFDLTQLSVLNAHSRDPLPSYAAMIHYCCGDRIWTKRRYWKTESAPRVWDAKPFAHDGTVASEIISQIRAAKSFYSSSHIW